MIRSFVEPIEILLVEDSPSDIRLTQEALKESTLRNTLHVVKDGDEALDYLHRRGDYADVRRPDLVLLDLNLPSLDGREVLARLKKDGDLKHIPVVVLTGSINPLDETRARSLGATAVYKKPGDLDDLGEVVKEIVHKWIGEGAMIGAHIWAMG